MHTVTSPAPATVQFDWDDVGEPMAIVTQRGHALMGNRSFVALVDELGERWLHLLAPASRERLHGVLESRGDSLVGIEIDPGSRPGEASRWFTLRLRWRDDGATCVCTLHDVSEFRQAEQAAQAQAAHLRLLANKLPVLIAHYHLSTFRCLYANQLYAQTFGLDEKSVLGRTFAEVIGEEAARQIQPSVDRVIAEQVAVSYERKLVGADGSVRWLESTLVPQFNAAGTLEAAFVLISDITRHRTAEIAMRESEERLSKFMQATVEGILFHVDLVMTDANPALCQLTGYSLEEILGRNVLELIAPDHRDRASAIAAARLETTYETMIVHRDGTRIPAELITRQMRDGTNTRMAIVRDVRDRVAAQARINFLAHHDSLTGLPNRSAFMDHLDQLMLSARATQAELALLFIDLDHFKRVNDSLGHLVGDALLRTVARRILDSVRGTDRVARFGGDEFMVLLPGMRDRADIEQVAGKLLSAIEVPMEAEGRPLSVTPSVGIAIFPRDGTTPDELIKHADTAMYVAKSRGRANFQFFEPANAVSAYADMVLEGQLAHAIEREEFTLFFQPQVSADDGRLVGLEALIRWQHPDHGLLSPDEFIPLAEQRRLMLPIGQWVLREAARCAHRWRESGLRNVPVAVNLSTMQFRALDFVDQLAQVLREERVPGAWLELELTERMLMDDLNAVRRTLVQLKAMGIRLSVDDFGTGYSSLGHLKDLPIDKMKIDRSFIKDLPGERDSVAITSAIIQMARSLELTVVAEGVETVAQARFLAEHGCHALQGSAISPPLDRVQLEQWATSRMGRSTSTSL
jgi:diguanylate cyclase (GGDEF)-like protein/PAS domain S-box-containing protein